VTFDQDPIIAGYTKDGSNDVVTHVTATVLPATAAPGIKIADAGQDRVAISNVKVNGGTITFDVRGKSATPSTANNGDTTVQALDTNNNNNVLKSANAIVVVPTAIGNGHDVKNGVPPPFNDGANVTTSPSASDIDKDHLGLATFYIYWLDVRVVDQWGHTLPKIYEGTPVTEDNKPLNQDLDENGVYQDPVGTFGKKANQPQVIAANDQADLNAWKASRTNAPPAKPNSTVPQNYNVTVGGFDLSPAIVNRTDAWSTDATGAITVTITWPHTPGVPGDN
jgi:hypothetical protein